MKKMILALSLTMACALTAYSQQSETRASGQTRNDTSTSVTRDGNSIHIQSGSRLAAELQNSIDVRKAKISDQVVLKTTQAIKSEGRTVINRGARLIGHVTEVEQKTKANGASRIGLVFNRLEKGALEFPISATITSITASRASARSGDEDLFAADTRSSTSARATSSGQNSGGLLGGVTNTAGGVVSTAGNVGSGTTSAVGATVDSTTGAGGPAAGLSRSLGRIEITESSSTSADGGAVLSLRGENLRLAKGTTFSLLIHQSASASTSKQQ